MVVQCRCHSLALITVESYWEFALSRKWSPSSNVSILTLGHISLSTPMTVVRFHWHCSVCLSVCLFIRTMSKKPLLLGPPNFT